MDSMRTALSFEGNMEGARAAGQEKSAKLHMAQERLRKELAKRKEAAANKPLASNPFASNPSATIPVVAKESTANDEIPTLNIPGKQGKNKKNTKK
jgi:hypothetical protein